MRILVTGSEGFIGRHVMQIARDRGHRVTGLDKKKNQYLSSYHLDAFDVVIHLAAYIDIKESFEKPWDYIDNNLIALRQLKDAARVVFASSAAVYGDFSPYGYTKRLAEHVLPENSIALRLFNPFGPHENHENETHIIPLLTKGNVTLFNNGEQIRDFIDVRDAAMAFVLSAESDLRGAYDLSNTPLTIKEVADLMGVEYTLTDDPRDAGDTLRLVGNPAPLQKALNWEPKHNVKEELRNWKTW